MKYLIVVAHPDDEVLGAGASISKWTQKGDIVDVCILCSEAKARAFRPKDKELENDLITSSNVLGVNSIYEGPFPNIEMNIVPHINIVQFIEQAMIKSEPEIVITHHPSDTNNDHLQTSIACQAAIRLFQRREEMKPISEFWFMEVLSATDWSVDSSRNRFIPNVYVEVGKNLIDVKLRALHSYRGVMRPYPHPRSEESILGLATYRGSQSGCNYAEAFECVLRRIAL